MSSSATAKIPANWRKADRKVVDLFLQVSFNNYLSKYAHGKKLFLFLYRQPKTIQFLMQMLDS